MNRNTNYPKIYLITIHRAAKGAGFILKCILIILLKTKGSNDGKYLVSNYVFVNLKVYLKSISLIYFEEI